MCRFISSKTPFLHPPRLRSARLPLHPCPACWKGWEPRNGGQPCICSGWAAVATKSCDSREEGESKCSCGGKPPQAVAADGLWRTTDRVRDYAVPLQHRKTCSGFTPPSCCHLWQCCSPPRVWGFDGARGCLFPGNSQNLSSENATWARNGVMAAALASQRGQDREHEVSCTEDS